MYFHTYTGFNIKILLTTEVYYLRFGTNVYIDNMITLTYVVTNPHLNHSISSIHTTGVILF